MSRPLTITSPLTNPVFYTYDSAGNLKTQTDAKNQTLWFNYDQLNRLIEKRQNGSTGPLLASYTYDAYDPASGQYGRGQRTGMSDPSGSASWRYDTRGRMTRESKTITGAGTFDTFYSYDLLDRVATLTYPGSGEAISHTYTVQGPAQVRSLDYSLNYAGGLTYNALGQLKRVQFSNGQETRYNYYGLDTAGAAFYGRLYQSCTIGQGSACPVTLGAGPKLNLSYGYDAVGNVSRITDTVNSNQVQAFGYDALDRLVSASATGGTPYSESYAYSATGNLVSKGGVSQAYGAQSASCPAGALNKPHALVSAGSTTFCYDANGNRVSRSGGTSYSWDAQNRLSSATVNGQTTGFVYDGDGARVLQLHPDGRKTAYVGNLMEVEIAAPTPTPTPSPTPEFCPPEGCSGAVGEEVILASLAPGSGPASLSTPGPLARLLGLAPPPSSVRAPAALPTLVSAPPAGQTWKVYYYAGGQRMAMRVVTDASSGTLYYLHGDHLGSTSVSVRASDGQVLTQRYYPYGTIRPGPGNALPTDYTFTGQRLDATGLLFYQARYYDPVTGRFLGADTIVPKPSNPQALNRYSYVVGNPLKYTDPSGHCFTGTLDTVLCVTALVGLAVALSVVPGDSRYYDAPPGNTVVFAAGMAATAPKLAFDVVTGVCAADPERCQQVGQWLSGGLNQAKLSSSQIRLSKQLGQNVWQMGLQVRGEAIETAFGKNTPAGYPVVDRFLNGTATSIKSIDLSLKTYQTTQGLWNKVAGYIEKLIYFQGKTYGGYTILQSQIAKKELLLAISPNATQAQLQLLQQLQKWAANNGVTLTITTVH